MRRLLWLPVVAVLVLAARWLCYALAAPSPLSGKLEASAGGPRLLVVTLVSVALGAGLSVFMVWVAALGVRERARLRPERVAPRLRLQRLLLRFLVLYAASSLAFALFESYLHWRAGIGFHGLSCLIGPVHRNALPILAALSLVAAALAEAGAHVLAWMRAVVRALRRRRLAGSLPQVVGSFHEAPVSRPDLLRARPRAPPLPA
jgi:hypothetical protein